MNDHVGVGNEELHAFIDGEVDPNRGAEIVELAAADAILASRIAAFRADKERLGEAYGKVRDLPLPSEWLRLIEDQTPGNGHSLRWLRPDVSWARLQRLFCCFWELGLPTSFSPWPAQTDPRRGACREAECDAPGTVSRSRQLAAQDARDQVLKRGPWHIMVKVPDLTRLGYQLADIHVYSGVPGGRAVELTYVDPQKRLFTLYLRHPSGPPRVDLLQRDRMRICIWQDDVVGTVGRWARCRRARWQGLRAWPIPG